MKKDDAFVCPSITEIPKCQTSIFSIMVWVWDCPDKRSPGQEPSPSVELFLAYWSVLQIHCCLSEPWKPNKERHHEHKKVTLIHSVWVTQAPYMPQWVWKFHFFLLCSSASRHRDADAFVRSLNRCASSILVPRHEGWLGRTGIVWKTGPLGTP